MKMSNVIKGDFGGGEPLQVRYPYIIAYCQHLGYSPFTRSRMLKQAEKDRPGRTALFPLKKGKWIMLADWADQEQREVLKDLVTLKGIKQ